MTVLLVVLSLAMAAFVYVFLVGMATGGTFRDIPLGAHIYALPFAGAFVWLAGAILGLW